MSLQISAGAKSLLSLGVSLGDLAVIFRHGNTVGNWLRAAGIEKELFESILEDRGALLRRRGLINVVQMKKRWSQLDFIYEGNIRSSLTESTAQEGQDLSEFSWLMVAVVIALDITLPSSTIKSLLIEVITTILEGPEAMRESLRVQLPNNVEAWRSVGVVRGMVVATSTSIRQTFYHLVQERAIPQLNRAEQEEMKDFLSPSPCAHVASILELVEKGGKKAHNPGPTDTFQNLVEMGDPLQTRKGLQVRAQQVSFPMNHPNSMIDAITLDRSILNEMEMFWTMGWQAAETVELIPASEPSLPFGLELDIYYVLDAKDPTRSKFAGMLSMIADHSFPVATHSFLLALEKLTNGVKSGRLQWLHAHTAREYLQKEAGMPSRNPRDMELWVKYQALVFGFYHALSRPLVSFELHASLWSLPVIDLTSDSRELYSRQYQSIDFTRVAGSPARQITPRGPEKSWSVHAKLGEKFGEESNDIMIVAWCDGKLVGWFGPLAADFTFLSSCYQDPRNVKERDYEDDSTINGHEILDEYWQNDQVLRPVQEDSAGQFCIVHSRGSAALRYAAVGFFANAGEEVGIATDDISAAFGRLEAQGAGIVVA